MSPLRGTDLEVEIDVGSGQIELIVPFKEGFYKSPTSPTPDNRNASRRCGRHIASDGDDLPS